MIIINKLKIRRLKINNAPRTILSYGFGVQSQGRDDHRTGEEWCKEKFIINYSPIVVK